MLLLPYRLDQFLDLGTLDWTQQSECEHWLAVGWRKPVPVSELAPR